MYCTDTILDRENQETRDITIDSITNFQTQYKGESIMTRNGKTSPTKDLVKKTSAPVNLESQSRKSTQAGFGTMDAESHK